MSNILYMAISTDGFIADENDNTPWSDEEWAAFHTFAETCDVLLLGRRTYEIMRKHDDFVEGPEYIVVTNNPSLPTDGLAKTSIDGPEDMPEGGRVGIIGGGELNGRLAKMGVINEMILDIEPITLGKGIRLFGKYDVPLKLELIGSKQIGEGTIQRHYRVL
ncbi:MAG TPA: dihydrofolate reductase family protein [Patescibacteria group bacterium]|nr:dihydrofolate reductase family protein [Patescibacteria group bacterium]